MNDQTNLPATREPGTRLVRTDDFLANLGLKFKKQITRTVLSQKNMENRPFAVTITSTIFTAQRMEGDTAKKEPPRMCEVTNLETGELQLLIMNTVLEGELKRYYGDDGFVGRSFVIRGTIKERGKDMGYRVYQIAEIEHEPDGEWQGEVVTRGDNPVNRAGVEPGKRAKNG